MQIILNLLVLNDFVFNYKFTRTVVQLLGGKMFPVAISQTFIGKVSFTSNVSFSFCFMAGFLQYYVIIPC